MAGSDFGNVQPHKKNKISQSLFGTKTELIYFEG